MALIHSLGFPRIGAKRELKIALESFWQDKLSEEALLYAASSLRQTHWQMQSALDVITIGDFSLYDQVLDMTFLLGNFGSKGAKAAKTFSNLSYLNAYFLKARGKSTKSYESQECECVEAGEMKKWFDTNYHYIVPEISSKSTFNLNPAYLLSQIDETLSSKLIKKVVLIGPLTYLWLSQSVDNSEKLQCLPKLLSAYQALFTLLKEKRIDWVQIDEPILVTELTADWQNAFTDTYQKLANQGVKLLLTTYFGQLMDNFDFVKNLPVDGLHIDGVRGVSEIEKINQDWPLDKVLSIGVVNGRNIWKTHLKRVLDKLEAIAVQRGDNLWIAPSCSLLHVPYDLNEEQLMSSEIKNTMAFALEKVAELVVIKKGLMQGRDAVHDELVANQDVFEQLKNSTYRNNLEVQQMLKYITSDMSRRNLSYADRQLLQKEALAKKGIKLPLFPTTTIGSFPQTTVIRQIRREWKRGDITTEKYTQLMHAEIARAIKEQVALDLDVLVHGEAERNDMVEYFGEQLSGFVFTQSGWVQSYGSRCVKPPIIFGDIKRPHPMTLEWTRFAQSLTEKPVKGMLTGPVTILNWSFVRDDQSKEETCKQLAMAIRSEVLDLEQAGISIIQIDEAALREGLPLRRTEWADYLKWAIECFCLAANGVKNETQIHTHMCYSQFSDIMGDIVQMDADVITIETARSNMSLLDSFSQYDYPNEVGPGLYDIHSPNIPSVQLLTARLNQAIKHIPKERLWVNPDCGLKTRKWNEVIPALKHMVLAAKALRDSSANS